MENGLYFYNARIPFEGEEQSYVENLIFEFNDGTVHIFNNSRGRSYFITFWYKNENELKEINSKLFENLDDAVQWRKNFATQVGNILEYYFNNISTINDAYETPENMNAEDYKPVFK